MSDQINTSDLESPLRSLRKRKSIDYSEQNLASRSRRNSASKASTAPDLEFITEREESDFEIDENEDTFAPSSVLNEAQDAVGKELFGFQTPKKSGGMALKVAEEMKRTPLSEKNAPTSSSKVTPGKRVTPQKSSSNPSTPIRGILKTPTSAKRGQSRLNPETPLSSRKRVKKTLIKISENDITHNYSDSDSDDGTQEQRCKREFFAMKVGYLVCRERVIIIYATLLLTAPHLTATKVTYREVHKIPVSVL